MTAPSARSYQVVLPEITTALFACPDCGAVVWHALRDKHDQLHEQIDGLIGTSWRHTELLDTDGERLDEHASQLVSAFSQIGDVERSAYRLDDQVRDLGYRVDEAQRTAERAADAAASASRGW